MHKNHFRYAANFPFLTLETCYRRKYLSSLINTGNRFNYKNRERKRNRKKEKEGEWERKEREYERDK